MTRRALLLHQPLKENTPQVIGWGASALKRWLLVSLCLSACGLLDSSDLFPFDASQDNPSAHSLLPLAHSLIHELDQDQDGKLDRAERAMSPGLSALEGDFRFGNDAPMNAQRLASFLDRSLTAATDKIQGEPTRATGKTPVLLVQGWGEPSWSLMYGIYRHLKKNGYPVTGINLFPNAADIDHQAQRVKALSLEILQQTGAPRITLIGHSMGGLISRSFLQKYGGHQWIDQIITISSPHYGTYAAYLGPGQGARQMEPGSSYLKELNRKINWPPVRIHCIWSPHDEFVIPQKNAQLKGTHIFPGIPYTGHGSILFSERTYRQISEVLP